MTASRSWTHWLTAGGLTAVAVAIAAWLELLEVDTLRTFGRDFDHPPRRSDGLHPDVELPTAITDATTRFERSVDSERLRLERDVAQV